MYLNPNLQKYTLFQCWSCYIAWTVLTSSFLRVTGKRWWYLILFCMSIWVSWLRNFSFCHLTNEEIQALDCSLCSSWKWGTVVGAKTGIYTLLLHFHSVRFRASSLQLNVVPVEQRQKLEQKKWASIFHINKKDFCSHPCNAFLREHSFVTIYSCIEEH